jgi:hypothetical protein
MSFLTDLFDSDSLELGVLEEIAGGGLITLEDMPLAKGAPGVGQYVATIAVSIGKAADAIRVLVDYLCRKRKGHEAGEMKVVINRREWHFDQSELTRVIEETIEVEQKKSGRQSSNFSDSVRRPGPIAR